MPLSELYFNIACEYENKAYGNGKFHFINTKHLEYANYMLRLAIFHAEVLGY